MKLMSLIIIAMTVSCARTPEIKPTKVSPQADVKFLSECARSTECELKFILEIAKTYRPPKEEKELRDYILAIKEVSEQHFWKKNLETFQDKIGNLMIRLPATGRFSHKKMKHFALQSHMDMVLAYADAKPGEDLRPYFKNGIKLEVKDGWLQSVGSKTSIGTDNSTGVAYSLRYLIDPTIEHPPLELIFTVQEEIGLIGAFESQLPILSKKMLCLDGMTPEPGYIIAGSQGGSASHVHYDTDKSHVAKKEDHKIIDISLTQMAGGHSGGDIFRNRANALKVFASLLKYLSTEVKGVSIKNVVIGDVGIMNKIPNLFNAQLVVPNTDLKSDLKLKIEKFLKDVVQNNPDDAANAIIKVSIGDGPEKEYLATNDDFTSYFYDSILKAPNGVIEKQPLYANSVKTSNNLSFYELKSDPKKESSFVAEFGFLARGFEQKGINGLKKMVNSIINQDKHVDHLTSKEVMNMPPWIEPESSELMQTVMTIPEFSKKFYISGGLEPSAFKMKIPGLETVALGPYQIYAHSVKERLKIDTIYPTGKNILRIIQAQTK